MYPFKSLLGDFGRFFCRKVNFWSLLPVTSVEIVQFTGWCYTLRERSVVIVQYVWTSCIKGKAGAFRGPSVCSCCIQGRPHHKATPSATSYVSSLGIRLRSCSAFSCESFSQCFLTSSRSWLSNLLQRVSLNAQWVAYGGLRLCRSLAAYVSHLCSILRYCVRKAIQWLAWAFKRRNLAFYST